MASRFVNSLERRYFIGLKNILRFLSYPDVYEAIFDKAGITLDKLKEINQNDIDNPEKADLMADNAIEALNDVIDDYVNQGILVEDNDILYFDDEEFNDLLDRVARVYPPDKERDDFQNDAPHEVELCAACDAGECAYLTTKTG